MPKDVTASSDSDFDYVTRAEELRVKIEYHADRYYNQDDPEIADADYDALVRELSELEDAHPDIRTEESLTSRVGGQASALFTPVEHAVPMMSLDNAFE